MIGLQQNKQAPCPGRFAHFLSFVTEMSRNYWDRNVLKLSPVMEILHDRSPGLGPSPWPVSKKSPVMEPFMIGLQKKTKKAPCPGRFAHFLSFVTEMSRNYWDRNVLKLSRSWNFSMIGPPVMELLHGRAPKKSPGHGTSPWPGSKKTKKAPCPGRFAHCRRKGPAKTR